MDTEQSKSGVKIDVTHSTHIELELTDCGGTLDGIDLCVNGSDQYTISPEGAEAIAAALKRAAKGRRS